jgi:hypothetical protein
MVHGSAQKSHSCAHMARAESRIFRPGPVLGQRAASCRQRGAAREKRAHGKASVGSELKRVYTVTCSVQLVSTETCLDGFGWRLCVALGLIFGALGRKVFSRWIGVLGALDLRLISTSSSSTVV